MWELIIYLKSFDKVKQTSQYIQLVNKPWNDTISNGNK